MAIEFGRTHVIGRSAGHTAIKAAAYRAGEKLFDERTGLVADYSHRADEVRHSEVLLPPGADSALADRRTLWEAIEAREDGHNRHASAQLAKDHIIALPRELGAAEQIEMARAFALEQLVSRGLVVDLAVHDHSAGNPHAHLMTTTRPLDGRDFGAKLRDDNGTFVGGLKVPDAEQLRHRWAEFQNRWMRERGIDEHVHVYRDELYRAEIHLGPASAMERREIRTQRGLSNEAIIDARTRTLLAHPEIVIERVADRKSLFTRHELYREANKLVHDADAFRHLRAKIDAHASLRVIIDRDHGDREYLTTVGVLALERRIRALGDALGRTAPSAAVDPAEVERALADRPSLSAEQCAAVRHVCGAERLAIVTGLAGTGKSSMLSAVRAAHEAGGRAVQGLALAGKAADELHRSSGIESRTLASWLRGLDDGRVAIESGALYVVDEAGMVDNHTMARALDAIRRGGAKAVLVGDAEQLQAIRAGCPFRDLATRLGHVEIATIRRQRRAWQREATLDLARGRAGAALDAYDRAGHVHRGSGPEIVERLVADYLDAGAASKAILAHRTAEVEELNLAVREARKELGQLGSSRWFHRGEEPEDASRMPIDLRIGDRVRCDASDPVLGFVAGRTGTWLGEEGGVRAVLDDDGRRIDFRASEYEGVRHLDAPKAQALELAIGDRVLFAQNDATLGVRNGMLGEVTAFDGTFATVRTDDGATVHVDDRSYPHLEHGYATTVHKAQGMSVERAFVLGQSSMDRHVGYVAMTRHRTSLDLYLAHEEFGQRSFATAIARARRQESALDLVRLHGIEGAVPGSDEEPGAARATRPVEPGTDVSPSPWTEGTTTGRQAPGEPAGIVGSEARPVSVDPAARRQGAHAELAPTAEPPEPSTAPTIDGARSDESSESPAAPEAAFVAAERVIAEAMAARLATFESELVAATLEARQASESARRALDAHRRDEPARGLLSSRRRHREWIERHEGLEREKRRIEAGARARATRDASGRDERAERARALALQDHPDAARTLARREALESARTAHASLVRLETLRSDPGTRTGPGLDRDIARLAGLLATRRDYLAMLAGHDRDSILLSGSSARERIERDRSRGRER